MTVDFKPPLATLQSLSERPGLTITPEGLFLVYPNEVIALDWKHIEQVVATPDDGGHGPTMLAIDTPKLSEIDMSIVVYFTSHTRAPSDNEPGDQALSMPHSVVADIARAAGLVQESEDSYVRHGGLPRPPSRTSYFPFDRKSPNSISVPLKQISKLPKSLGAICNQDGLFWCTPTSVESIRWNCFRNLEVREDIIYAGLAEESAPGDYTAISFQGKGMEPPQFFLNDQDYQKLAKLLKPKKALTKTAIFPLVSENEKTGPMAAEASGPNPFLPLQLEASPSIWPGSSLAKLKPIRSGFYLLPAGLIQVTRHAIFQANWEQIEMLSVGGDGQILLECDQARISLSRVSAQQTPALVELGKSILAITNLAPAESGSAGTYFKRPGCKVAAPRDSNVFLPENGEPDWQGPDLSDLGQTPWPDGFHFTPEGLYFVRGPAIEAVRWDRLQEFEVHEQKLFLVADRDRFRIPEMTWTELPQATLEAVKKQIEEYWTPGQATDQGTTAGIPKPYHARPQERHSILLKKHLF